MKLPLGDLIPSPYPPHLTNTYIWRVTIALRVYNRPVVLEPNFNVSY